MIELYEVLKHNCLGEERKKEGNQTRQNQNPNQMEQFQME